MGARSSHSMYSMSWRATSPSDQPAYRPKFRTVPDGRPGGGPAAPNPSAARIDSSNPPPWVERPEVQSRDTTSGGGGWAGRGCAVGEGGGGAVGREADAALSAGVPAAVRALPSS